MTQSTVDVERGLGAPTLALVVIASAATAALLVVPVLLLLLFAESFASGSTCSVGFQPFCTPGYGLPQLYAVLVAASASAAALLAGIVAAVRGSARTARALVLVAVALALVAIALVGARTWAGGWLPAGWFIA
ncbi:MAG: hypothetical protein AB7O74_16785 [Candidatus Nanopelagicales bacterium]